LVLRTRIAEDIVRITCTVSDGKANAIDVEEVKVEVIE